jgi:nitroreductase
LTKVSDGQDLKFVASDGAVPAPGQQTPQLKKSTMNAYDAVASRKSVRDFLRTPVDPVTIRKVLAAAQRAPSGGNLQPWRVTVIAGDSLVALKAVIRDKVRKAPDGEPIREYDIYPKNLASPYRERRFKVGEDMYRLVPQPDFWAYHGRGAAVCTVPTGGEIE